MNAQDAPLREQIRQLETANAVLQRQLAHARRREAKLLESEACLRYSFDLGLIGIAITSTSKGCMAVNNRLCDILGYPRSELLHLSWTDLTHPDDRAQDSAQFSRVSTGEIDGYAMEKRWIRRDGSVIDSFTSVKCHRLDDGSVDYFVSFLDDITARKLSERALEEDRARRRTEADLRRAKACLHGAQRLSHVGSWAWNLMTGEFFWSDELFAILGAAPGTTPSLHAYYAAVHQDDRARLRHDLEEAARRGGEFEADYRCVRADGQVRLVRSHAQAIVDDEGPEYVGTTVDVTEQKRTQEALREMQGALAQVTRVKALSELISSIAHGINQPLGALMAYGYACSRWLSADPPNMAEAQAAVRGIVDNGARAADLIRRMRAMMRHNETEKLSLDINAVIRDVVTLSAYEVQKHRVSLRTELAPTLPRVLGVPAELRQVVLNLVLNAVAAMSSVPERRRVLWIGSTCCALRDRPGVHVKVRDAGVGLAPSDLERIFDAFYTAKSGGFAMGLRIGQSIVESHGGRLWADLNDDCGATFQFLLPADGIGGTRHAVA